MWRWGWLALLTLAPLLGCVHESSSEECVWEGGQGFELLGASQDGDVVYLSLRNAGSPCGGGGWDVTGIVAADFTGYVAGDVEAGLVAAAVGAPLTSGTTIALIGLPLRLRPTTALTDSAMQSVSVSVPWVAIFEIENHQGEVLGELTAHTRLSQ